MPRTVRDFDENKKCVLIDQSCYRVLFQYSLPVFDNRLMTVVAVVAIDFVHFGEISLSCFETKPTNLSVIILQYFL